MKSKIRIKKIIYALSTLTIVVASIISCEPRDEINYNIDVYKPEILNDGKPDVEGNFWEIASNPDISLKQKALIEAVLFGGRIENEVGPLFSTESKRIEGLGVTDLNALKGVAAVGFGSSHFPHDYLRLYSTRLNDISILKEFVDLEVLTIRGSEIEDFSPISNLTKLRELDISYSKTKDLSALTNLNDLQLLTIDKESDLSLVPLKLLREEHLDSNNNKIHLEIKYIENKLKETPTSISGNSMSGKVTPTIKGKYKFIFIRQYTLTDGMFFSSEVEGELIMKETEFKFFLSKGVGNINTFEFEGTYRVVGNLIYFKKTNEEEYINSFYWGSSLSFLLTDRVSFVDTNTVTFTFRKTSDDPNKE